MTRCLCTLATGKYERLWRSLCAPSWQDYAQRHGYEIVVFEQPLDDSPRARGRSPAWQKLLVADDPRVAACDQAVWIDADIVLNAGAAPDICAGWDGGRMRICREFTWGDSPHLRWAAERWQDLLTAAHAQSQVAYDPDYYRMLGLEGVDGPVLNTGVFTFSPGRHGGFLRSLYDRYEDRGPGTLMEMVFLSAEMVRDDLAELIDPRFNFPLLPYVRALAMDSQDNRQQRPVTSGLVAVLRGALEASYFLHFAGAQGLMPMLGFLKPLADGRVLLAPRAIQAQLLREAEEAGRHAGPRPG